MTDQYTEAVAAHYSAYRPPLHQQILRRVLSGAGIRPVGLDVGCGTGRSSVALADFCERVFAVDPSESMLDVATPHKSVSYVVGSAENLPLPDRSVDIVTFAGSLFYADRDATVDQLKRICRPAALIVTYDFSVRIDDVLRPFDIATQTVDPTYDHSAGFAGVSAMTEDVATQERIRFDLTTTELAHILLADTARHGAFVSRYNTSDPLDELARELCSTTEQATTGQTTIEAEIFYALYRFRGDRRGR